MTRYEPTRWLAPMAILAATPALAADAVRVAIVSPGEAGADRLAVELAAVRLAGRPGFEVLERDAVRRVLAEQRLALGAEGDPVAPALAVGRLLAVDAFAVLRRVDQRQPDQPPNRRLIAYDAATGVRLANAPVGDGDAQATGDRVVAAVEAAVRKRRRFAEQGLSLLSFHGWRNADLPTGWAPWIIAARTELEGRFASLEGVAVLERAELHDANAERLLSAATNQARLLASAVNVLVQFERAPRPDAATVTLVVLQAGRKKPATFSKVASRADPSAALAELSREVAAALNGERLKPERLRSSSKEARRREVGRLRSEAERLLSREEYREAAVFGEAAWALAPDDNDRLSRLAFLLDFHARSLVKPLHQRRPQTPDEVRRAIARVREAIRVLDYRLDLIATLHGRRKHEADWPDRMARGDGFVPWHTAMWDLAEIDEPKRDKPRFRDWAPASLQDEVRDHWRRFDAFVFGELVRYGQRHTVDAADATQFVRTTYHQGRMDLSNAARALGRWPERLLVEHDGWADAFRKRGWDTAAPEHAGPWLAALRLLDFHRGDLHDMTAEQLSALLSRLDALTDHPAPKVAQRARRLAAAARVHHLRKAAPTRAEAVALAEHEIAKLSKAVLAELEAGFPPPTEDDLTPCGAWKMADIRFDQRHANRTRQLAELCDLHPDYSRRRELKRELFDRCMEMGVFSPALLYGSLPKHLHGGGRINAENRPERIAGLQRVITRLKAGEARGSIHDLDGVLGVLQSELRLEQTRLARGEAAEPAARSAEQPASPFPPGTRPVTPWDRLTLVAGQPGFPERRRHDPQRPRVLGFAHDDRHVYYLLKHSPERSAKRFTVSAYRARRSAPGRSTRIGSAAVEGRYADLPPKHQEHYDWTSSAKADGVPNPVAVDEHHLYWNRLAWGVLAFPLDGGEPFALDEAWGLPSNYVHCVVPARGKLHAWVGRPRKENLLVEVDIAEHAVRVLASSERARPLTALDDRRPSPTRLGWFDAPRGRLLFWIRNRVWAWDLDREQAEVVLDVRHDHGHYLRHIFPAAGGGRLLINRSASYWVLDLATDTTREISLPGDPRYGIGRPRLLMGDHVWFGNPWSRYDLTSHALQPLRSPTRDPRPPELTWNPWCERIGDSSQLLIGDRHHLWLAELKDAFLATPSNR